MALLPSEVAAAAHAFVDDLDAPRLDAHDLHHFARVLRLRPGERITVADGALARGFRPDGLAKAGRGRWRLARVSDEGLIASEGWLEVDEPAIEVERKPPVTVALAMTKVDRFELAVQKLAELGVDRIVVFGADHSVARWEGDKAARLRVRCETIVREAAMQSRQLYFSQVIGPVALEEALTTEAPFGPLSMADIHGGTLPGRCCGIAIGPEGGFSAAELALAQRCGSPLVRLPGGVLRAETAAIVAGALLAQARFGRAGV